MHALHRVPFVIAFSVVCMTSIGLVVRAPTGQPSRASSGLLHDASTHPPEQGRHGPIVILRVRTLVPEKVTLSDPAQGTVRATVLAIDKESNHIKVQTEEQTSP